MLTQKERIQQIDDVKVISWNHGMLSGYFSLGEELDSREHLECPSNIHNKYTHVTEGLLEEYKVFLREELINRIECEEWLQNNGCNHVFEKMDGDINYAEIAKRYDICLKDAPEGVLIGLIKGAHYNRTKSVNLKILSATGKNGIVTVETTSPGLLIGQQGSNIKYLQTRFGIRINIKKIRK